MPKEIRTLKLGEHWNTIKALRTLRQKYEDDPEALQSESVDILRAILSTMGYTFIVEEFDKNYGR